MKQYEKYAGNNFVLHIFLHRVDEICPRVSIMRLLAPSVGPTR